MKYTFPSGLPTGTLEDTLDSKYCYLRSPMLVRRRIHPLLVRCCLVTRGVMKTRRRGLALIGASLLSSSCFAFVPPAYRPRAVQVVSRASSATCGSSVSEVKTCVTWLLVVQLLLNFKALDDQQKLLANGRSTGAATRYAVESFGKLSFRLRDASQTSRLLAQTTDSTAHGAAAVKRKGHLTLPCPVEPTREAVLLPPAKCLHEPPH